MNNRAIWKIIEKGRAYTVHTTWVYVVGFELDRDRVYVAFRGSEPQGNSYVFWETSTARVRIADSFELEILRAAVVDFNRQIKEVGMAPGQI